MQRSRFAWWPLHRGRSLLSQESGAVVFRGIRINLTLWYCGVMATALVLFSVALYFSTQQFLIPPIKDDTARHAHAHLTQLLAGSPTACPSFRPPGQFGPPPGQGFVMSEMIACFELTIHKRHAFQLLCTERRLDRAQNLIVRPQLD